MERKKVRRLYTWLQILLLVIISIAGYRLFIEYSDKNKEADIKEELSEIAGIQKGHEQIDFTSLQQQNPDIIAWLYIPDTAIDYPVVKGADNRYYLQHSFLREANTFGAIFMDAYASSNLQDPHTILYGHNVPSGEMFKDLDKFKNFDFFNAHQTFYLYTPQGNYALQIFSFYQTREDSDAYTVFATHNQNYEDFLQQRMALSMHQALAVPTMQDTTITLSTCSYESGKGIATDLRYVLHAKLERL